MATLSSLRRLRMLRAELIPKSNTYPNPKGDIQELVVVTYGILGEETTQLIAIAIGDWEIKSKGDNWPWLKPTRRKNWPGVEMEHEYVPIPITANKVAVCIQNHSVGGPGTYWIVDEVYVDGRNYIAEEVLNRMRSKK
jgi:hypothetical protein